MKFISYLIILLFFFCCANPVEKSNDTSTVAARNSIKYFDLINQAELFICDGKFETAAHNYKLAFSEIEKPFGKDVYNAALACQFANNIVERNNHLQVIINNSDDLDFVKAKFVVQYMTQEEWQNLLDKRQIEFDPKLRQEFKDILDLDQLYRPMYDTHDDTINANRKINLKRILALTDSVGFPSHIELGYTRNFRGQNHDIVLHHTAQRRSYDKSVTDLEDILFKAVNEKRFDPETAIFYMNFQNDLEKGKFEVYSTWQYKHPLLPDSLNAKVWLPKLNAKQRAEAESKRQEWNANSLDNIAAKSNFKSSSNLPFIFTSIKNSIGNMPKDFTKEKALEKYKSFTKYLEEYVPKKSAYKG